MKHCVLFKLAPGTDPVEVQEKLWKVSRKLDDELDWLNHPMVYRRCDDTASSYDLMMSLELESEARLAEYLAHPLTKKLEEKLAEVVVEKATFDHY